MARGNTGSQKGFHQSNKGNKRVLVDEEFYNQVIEWNTFFRRNIHRFVEMYFGFNLHFYQIIMIYMMNLVPFVVIVAARSSAKSYITAVFSCARCILYPNTKVVIASSTKKQATLIISEKIQKELMPRSANLRREIKSIRAGANETEVIFWNNSSIIVVTASENARGYVLCPFM